MLLGDGFPLAAMHAHRRQEQLVFIRRPGRVHEAGVEGVLPALGALVRVSGADDNCYFCPPVSRKRTVLYQPHCSCSSLRPHFALPTTWCLGKEKYEPLPVCFNALPQSLVLVRRPDTLVDVLAHFQPAFATVLVGSAGELGGDQAPAVLNAFLDNCFWPKTE